MAKVSNLTHERLTELLAYEPATGVFSWKVSPSNSVKAGSRAGVFHPLSGGRYLTIDGERFMAHRVAWFYVKREWPKHDLRADNGNFDDCRIDNLRDVPRIEIAHLRSAPKTNTSGYLGVSPSSKKGKWQATITWNYRQIGLGANFDTPEEASEIYREADLRLKAAASDDAVERIVQELRLFRRQRAAWKHLHRQDASIGWASFEAFAADIKEIPQRRYALVAIDVAKPIGPDNFRWSLPVDAEHNSFVNKTSYARANRLNNRDLHRAKHLKKEYGADIGYERKLLVEQNGLCAICEQPENLARGKDQRCLSLDHDHKTGTLRGLLCGNCNMGVGYLCDDPELLKKAAAYIERYAAPVRLVWSTPSIVEITAGQTA